MTVRKTRPGRRYEIGEPGITCIQPGDTMWSISRTLLGDPWAFRGLAETNEIEDPNTIYPVNGLQFPRNEALTRHGSILGRLGDAGLGEKTCPGDGPVADESPCPMISFRGT